MGVAEMPNAPIDVPGGDMVHLVRDVLDEVLMDRRHRPIGRADGVMLNIAEGRPPRVMCIESGIVVAASRVNRHLGRWARAAARRWGLSRGRLVRIGWEHMVRLGVEATLDLDADQTRALVWEQWLLRNIVRYVPSLKPSEKKDETRQQHRTTVAKSPAAERVRGRRIRLQRLLGRKVVDKDGRVAGRIEEVRAHVRDGAFIVESFELGRRGLLERLSIRDVSLAMVRMLGAHRGAGGHRVPWQQMDLSDLEHPRLTCGVAELKSSGDE
jgi:sporulation protein YlmC with PRC-barrel domain